MSWQRRHSWPTPAPPAFPLDVFQTEQTTLVQAAYTTMNAALHPAPTATDTPVSTDTPQPARSTPVPTSTKTSVRTATATATPSPTSTATVIPLFVSVRVQHRSLTVRISTDDSRFDPAARHAGNGRHVPRWGHEAASRHSRPARNCRLVVSATLRTHHHVLTHGASSRHGANGIAPVREVQHALFDPLSSRHPVLMRPRCSQCGRWGLLCASARLFRYMSPQVGIVSG